MQSKKVSLVINPRAGQNFTKLNHIMSLFSAAGWETELEIKVYGGQTLELAREAAKRGCDLLIAYGGDGTLNYVVNGAMQAGAQTAVGIIPGGTANVWATEVGVPTDPVKAALTLLTSMARPVDIGRVAVADLSFPCGSGSSDQQADHQEKPESLKHKIKMKSHARQHFLLMAGLGIDAAVMGNVSKPAKYRIGPLAVGLAAAKELPAQHPFPLELWNTTKSAAHKLLWKGDARQVVIGNTRLYAKVMSMTPKALIDDGLLDVCVITAGDPLTTFEQIMSFLLHRSSEHITAEYFQGAHISMRVPSWVQLQVDGSAVRLKDYLRSEDRAALRQAENNEESTITYHFDALPRALPVAFPASYDDTLFEESNTAQEDHAQSGKEGAQSTADNSQAPEEGGTPLHDQPAKQGQATHPQVELALEKGRKVTIIGVSPHPTKKQSYIAAGTTPKRHTGEDTPVAVIFDEQTKMVTSTGEPTSLAKLQYVPEGAEIVVVGKKNKRGVIAAKQAVIELATLAR